MRRLKSNDRALSALLLAVVVSLTFLLLCAGNLPANSASTLSLPVSSTLPVSSALNDIARRETVFNTDFTSAGFGGLRNIGSGAITLAGVSGRVTRALLYWHGPTNSTDPAANSAVTFAGVNITGTQIGFSGDNFWSFANSQAYRADVSLLVPGNGTYALSNFRKPGVEINGASLIVFFDDGNSANNRDVVIFDGNDSNQTNPFDSLGWNLRLDEINYRGGEAKIELHVSDGQDFLDDSLILNGSRTLAPAGAVFQGLTVPNGASASTTGGGLWDIKSFAVTAALNPGLNTLTLTTGFNRDFLSLIVALIDLPAGAAPPGSGRCGPLDVALIIDDTSSMQGAIDNVKAELLSILDNIVTASGNDYRIALLTFKDDVTIRENFVPNNRSSIEGKIRALVARGGAGAAEASDEALNTVINALPAAGRRQNDNFNPAFRSAATKVAILVTDAPPGGFDDTFTPGVDDVNARQRAQEAAVKGIKISAIFVPTGGDYDGQRAIMRDYAAISRGAFIETPPDGVGTGAAIMGIIEECGNTPPPADLALALSATPNPVLGGATVTYNINVGNNGPNLARNVVLSMTLPSVTTFQAITAPAGWSCSTPPAGGSGAISCARATLANGVSAAFNLSVGVNCSAPDGLIINQSAIINSTNDPNSANDSAAVGVRVNNPASQIRLTIAGGRSAMDFGSVPAARELNPNPPSDTFTIENPGCAPALLSFSISRTGGDVASGRIANTDDSALFPVRIINTDGSETPLSISPGSPPVQIPGGQSRSYRVRFNPLIPILAGRTTELFANQVIPDAITSQLTITSGAGAPLMVNLAGRVLTPAKMIHPSDSRLEPLVIFTRAGDEFTIECSTHDSNLDLRQARYQFLDQNDRPVGAGADVGLLQPIAQRNLVRGQSFTIVQKFTGASQRPEISKVQVTLLDGETTVTTASAVLGVTEAAIASVSAASFLNTALASESIVSSFGSGLAPGVQTAANTPLPTSLSGVTVRVRDGAGVERASPLFFVSPGQINFQIPAGTMVGAATVSVVRENRIAARGVVQITNASPGLFAANANGQGAAAAVELRIGANGSQQFEPVTQFDPAQNRFVTRSLDFGSSGEQLYLALFGAGVRFRRSTTPVVVRIGGVESQAIFAGAQGGFVGLDQINVLVPRSLAGRGEVDVMVIVDGRTSNPVRARFGGSAPAPPATRAEMVNDQDVRDRAISRETAAMILLPVLKLTPDPAPQSEGRGVIQKSGGTKEK